MAINFAPPGVKNRAYGLALDSLTRIAQRVVLYAGNAASPLEIPDPSAIFHLRNEGLISDQLACDILRWHGVFWDAGCDDPPLITDNQRRDLGKLWQGVSNSLIETPSIDDLIALFWRGVIKDDGFKLLARREGWSDPAWVSLKERASYAMPSAADYLRFSDAGAFDDAVLARWDLAGEQPGWLKDGMRSIGVRGQFTWPGIVPPDHANDDAADVFWRSHWTWPSLNQGLIAAYRLRENAPGSGTSGRPDGLTYTEGDFHQHARALGLPSKWRETLWALRHNPLGTRQVASLVELGVLTQADGSKRLQDLGYSEDDSFLLLAATVERPLIAHRRQQKTAATRQVVQAYSLGAIERNDAAVMLYKLFLTDPQQVAQFNGQAAAQQQSAALANADVQFQLALMDSDVNLSEIRGSVLSVKRRFFRGQIASANLQQALRLSGLTVTAAARQARQLLREFTPPKRELESGKLLQLYRRGLLSALVLQTRLTNIGWSAADVALLQADTDRDVASDLLRAQEKTARTLAQRQRAQAAQVRAAAAAQKAAAKRLAGHASEAQLEKWFLAGLVPAREFASRLEAMGYSVADVNRLVAYAEEQANAKKAGKPTKPPVKPAAGSKGPGAETLARWVSKGILTHAEGMTRIQALGWDNADAADLIAAAAAKAKGSGSGKAPA